MGNELDLPFLATGMRWNKTGTMGIDGSPRHGPKLDIWSKQGSSKSWNLGWAWRLRDSLHHHVITRDGLAWHGYDLPCSVCLVCLFV